MTTMAFYRKMVLWTVMGAFLFNTIYSHPVQADTALLPSPNRLVQLTPPASPLMLRGLKVFKDNPLKFDFVIDQGEGVFKKEESIKLVKYFLASLTVPEKDMWVNLSPYEKNRLVAKEFGSTEMGKELLVQDYLLKQVTASVMYPEGEVGKKFWKEVYAKAYQKFGNTKVPVNSFNKVWIVPDKAAVYENALTNTTVIIESKLKVMLEEDYLAAQVSLQGRSQDQSSAPRNDTNDIIRQIILPILEREVNTGKNFASLRQVYNALILGVWYKNKLKQSLISKGYVDRNKINGVDVEDKNINEEIYEQYLKSFKQGVYNYIKEDILPDKQVMPRKYFSGGVSWDKIGGIVRNQSMTGNDAAQLAASKLKPLKMLIATVGLAALMGAGSAAAQTQASNPFVNSGAVWVETYAKNHQAMSEISGLTQGSGPAELSAAISRATNGEVQLGPKGIGVLTRLGLLKVNGSTFNIDLKEIRRMAAGVTVLPTPPQAGAVDPVVTKTIKPGDTASDIFANSPEIQHIKQILGPDKKISFDSLSRMGAISFRDSTGNPVSNPDFKRIQPDWKITFDLTSLMTAPAVAGTPTPPPPPPVPPQQGLGGAVPASAAIQAAAVPVPAPIPQATPAVQTVVSPVVSAIAEAVTFSLDQFGGASLGISVPGAREGLPQLTAFESELLAQARSHDPGEDVVVRHVSERGRALVQQYSEPIVAPGDARSFTQEVGINARYDALMDLLNGPSDKQPYRVIYSIKAGEEYKPLRVFKTADEFTDFITRFSTNGRFFKALSPQQGPLEVSKLFNPGEFTEVTSPMEVEKMTDDGRHYFAFLSGRDAQGDFQGVAAGGVRSALDKVEFIRLIRNSYNLLNEMNQKMSVPTNEGNGLIVGAYIERDKGLIKKNIRYITRDAVKTESMTMADLRKRKGSIERSGGSKAGYP